MQPENSLAYRSMQPSSVTAVPASQNGGEPSRLPRTQVAAFAPTGDDWDLRRYVRMLRRRWLAASMVGLASLSYFIGSALIQEQKYQGRFRFLIESGNSVNPRLAGLTNLAPGLADRLDSSGADYETQIQILQSPDLLDRAVKRLAPVYPGLTYTSLLQGLTISRVGRTKILEVRYQSDDPTKIRAVLEQLSKDYLAYSSKERQVELNQGVQFVNNQLVSARQRVDQLQKELQVFRQQNAFLDPDSQAARVTAQLQQLSQDKQKLEQDIARERAALTTLQGEDGAIAALNNSASYQKLVEQLRQTDTQIALELARFNEGNLAIRVLRTKQNNLVPLLREEAQRTVEGKVADTASRLQILESQQQVAAQVEQGLNQQFQRLPVLARQYTDLQRELTIATESLNRLLTTRETLQVELAQNQIPWQIVEPATEKLTLLSPSMQENLMVGVLISALLGVAAALLLERLDGTYSTLEDLSKNQRFPVLGSIPYQKVLAADRETRRLVKQNKALSPTASESSLLALPPQIQLNEGLEFIESLRVLRANIQRLHSDQPMRSFVISSPLPGDGKSTLAFYLAQTAAEMGQRVLLVDADLRQSQLQHRLKLLSSRGLSDVLTDRLPLEEAIQQPLLSSGLNVLLSGEQRLDPAKVFSSSKMHHLSSKLDQLFDLVIYDAPPLNGLADTLLLAPHTDGVLLVVRLGKTDGVAVTKTLTNLKMSEIPTLGIVANGT